MNTACFKVRGNTRAGRGFDGRRIYAGEDYYIQVGKDSLLALSTQSIHPRTCTVITPAQASRLSVSNGVAHFMKDKEIVQ